MTCDAVCGKTLNCQNHKCQLQCHEGPCSKCEVVETQVCFCGQDKKTVPCGQTAYCCEQVCNKTLDCDNHQCQDTCHRGPCKPCPLTPEKLKKCGCGKLPLIALGAGNRTSCLDPVPSCGLPCGKKLVCGHLCKSLCHVGPCIPCQEIVTQDCRCNHSTRRIECMKVTSGSQEEKLYICERVCRKKKSCKQHKCLNVCCEATKGNDPEGLHLCIKVCGKPLNCGKHTCDLFCHIGNCAPCPVIINQPLTCACGATVKNPPLQCGTHPPSCPEPCHRSRPCGHPCFLNCHIDACPPCHELVEKICNCGKSKIPNVKCSMEVLCGKLL